MVKFSYNYEKERLEIIYYNKDNTTSASYITKKSLEDEDKTYLVKFLNAVYSVLLEEE